MIYEMKLNKEPFEMISNGNKTVELRLFDEKRCKLNIGDEIIFTDISDTKRKLYVRIKALYRFGTFEELFKEISPVICGYEEGETPESAAEKMKAYYTDENINKYGVLGISVELTENVI